MTITQTTTVYDNDVTTVGTLTQDKEGAQRSTNNQLMASVRGTTYGTTSGTYTYDVKRTDLVVAKFTVSGRFQYNDSSHYVKCLSYSSSKWIHPNYNCLKWNVYSENGGAGLFYKAWANVKGLLHISMKAGGGIL